jgi:predicted RNase H-like HicB family nuclease
MGSIIDVFCSSAIIPRCTARFRAKLEKPQVAGCKAIRHYQFMNYRFSAFITKENGWYVARCPELSVTSQGQEVASARATEAIELYLETRGLPERPQDTDSFRTTVEVS